MKIKEIAVALSILIACVAIGKICSKLVTTDVPVVASTGVMVTSTPAESPAPKWDGKYSNGNAIWEIQGNKAALYVIGENSSAWWYTCEEKVIGDTKILTYLEKDGCNFGLTIGNGQLINADYTYNTENKFKKEETR
jgi:hypothetical protein